MQHLTIGHIYFDKPNIVELTDNGFEEKIGDYYEFRVKECPNADHDISDYHLKESNCDMNIRAFPTFFFQIVGDNLVKKLKLKECGVIIPPEEISKFTSKIIFPDAFFILPDVSIISLKPLINEIKKLPDDCGGNYLPEDRKYFNDVMTWFKYWSVKAVELYDDDAYIEFC